MRERKERDERGIAGEVERHREVKKLKLERLREQRRLLEITENRGEAKREERNWM